MIDITADGAHMKLHVFFDNWTIRNVAVVGVNEGDGGWWVRAGGDGGTGDETALMENIWMGHGDGAGEASNNPYAAPNFFVDRNHIGTLTFNGIYTANCSNNGLYASAPGVDKGNGGVVHIKNSYGYNNTVSCFRLGTDGSTFENCVGHSGRDEIFRFDEGGNIDAIECDGSGVDPAGSGGSPFLVRDGATANLTNCRADNTNVRTGSGSGTVNGSLKEYPRISPPAGCPQTPNDALSGIRLPGWNT